MRPASTSWRNALDLMAGARLTHYSCSSDPREGTFVDLCSESFPAYSTTALPYEYQEEGESQTGTGGTTVFGNAMIGLINHLKSNTHINAIIKRQWTLAGSFYSEL